MAIETLTEKETKAHIYSSVILLQPKYLWINESAIIQHVESRQTNNMSILTIHLKCFSAYYKSLKACF